MSEQCKQVESFISRYRLIQAGDIVVLAVSGGIDSVVMAHLLMGLRERLDFQPVLANFNHKLRSEAEEEMSFVAQLAQDWGVPFHGGSADIGKLAIGHNLQDVARRERYAFLRQVAFRYNGAFIATAHHRDDQAETVLLHLLRGSGPAGLAGISPKENDLIRPMLCLSRDEIQSYATQHRIEYRQDESNFTTKYRRNRIRLELLPKLEAFNPQIKSTLNAMADICREEDSLLEDLAENALVEALDGEDRLSVEALSHLPMALRRRVIRKLFCLQAGDGAELTFSQVEAALSLSEEQAVSLPGGLYLYRRDGWLDLAREIPPLPICEQEYPLIPDGTWQQLEPWGWAYQCSVDSSAAMPPVHQLRSPRAFSYLIPRQELSHLYWRTRRPGDRVTNTAGDGSHKLKNLFIDEKIPQFQRQTWPLLADHSQIWWVPGLWKSKLPDITGENLLIKVRRSDNIIR